MNAVTVDPTRSVTSTEIERAAQHDRDASSKRATGTVFFRSAARMDADSTAFWDSQATANSWVESTLGAWKSTVPVRTRAGRGRAGLRDPGRARPWRDGGRLQGATGALEASGRPEDDPGDWHGNPEHLARFEIEAEAVARLNHPNIVRIYEIGKAGRVAYVVLELLEGGTLKERLAGTPQPFREAAALLSTLARGVNAAHVAGILHRDLKPSNVLFDHDGVPKIADFGLAKRLEVEDGETLTGQVLGTPSYMAPEQAKGWDRDIGAAADIYSLGAILYEMLTGRPPLKGATAIETLKLVQEEDPVPPSRLRSKLPFDLETICLKCIARDPRKRYPDALSLADRPGSIPGRRVDSRPPNAPLAAGDQAGAEAAGDRGPGRCRHCRVRGLAPTWPWASRRSARVVAETRERPGGRRAAGVADQDLFDAAGGPGTTALDGCRGDHHPAAEPDPSARRSRESSSMREGRTPGSRRHGLACEEQTATEQARARFRRFVDLRDEALFLDTTTVRRRPGEFASRRPAGPPSMACGVFGSAGDGRRMDVIAAAARASSCRSGTRSSAGFTSSC